MNARERLLFAALVAASGLRAQSDWLVCSGDADVRIVGSTTTVLRGPRAAARGLPAGEHTVHFGRDAHGKPASLVFAVPDGAWVHLAAGDAGPASGERFAADASAWHTPAGATSMRVVGPGERGDTLLELAFTLTDRTEAVAVIARRAADGAHYAFVFDRSRREVRIERHFGGASLVLARGERATAAARPQQLAFQLEGFRLQGLVDDEVVLQCFDGALTRGECGVGWRGDAPAWRELVIAPPSTRRTSAASVVVPGESCTLHVEPVVEPGHWHVLELRIDRPEPLRPTGFAGVEPGVLLPLGGAHVLFADLRDSLGSGSIGELAAGESVRTRVEWPDLPALRLQAALTRVLFVSADGSWVTAISPAVPVRR